MAVKELRGKPPTIKEKRLKLFMYGPAGIGKTWATIQFPQSYIIDTEKGTDFYSSAINNTKSVVFQSNNPDEIREEIHGLLTTKHDYKTVTIDPVTQVYNSLQEKWNRIFEKHAKTDESKEIQDWGQRYWGKVKSEFKAIQRMLVALDMNVICTSHQKDQYGEGMKKIGVTFDSMKGDDYLFDLVFRLEMAGPRRIARTIKERCEPGANKFPPEFEWSYANFCQFYGKDILERDAKPVDMANAEQVDLLEKLLKTVSIEPETVSRWLTAANCDSFREMTADTIEKCIGHCQKKIKEVTK